MKRQTNGAHGRTTPSTDGIYQLPPNTIARTDVTLKQPKVNGSRTQSNSHKHITKPTITHADKVMNVIADCAKAIKDITSPNGAEEMRQLVELTEQAIHQHSAIAKLFATPDSTTPSVPRVQGTELALRLTRSITQSLELAKQQIGRAASSPTEKPTSAPPMHSTSTRLSWKKRKQHRVVAAHSAPKSTTPAA